MKEIVQNEDKTFNDYILYLRESLENLSEYWDKIGHRDPYIQDIRKALKHADPFVLYNASIAATLILQDSSIYH